MRTNLAELAARGTTDIEFGMRTPNWLAHQLNDPTGSCKQAVRRSKVCRVTLRQVDEALSAGRIGIAHVRVLVEAAPAEEKTSFGIIIPDTAKEKPQRGTVIAVGSGKKDEPMTVQVGDTVLYGKYAGTEITVEGKEYLIMRESDIFAIL